MGVNQNRTIFNAKVTIKSTVYYKVREKGEGYVMPDVGSARGISLGAEFEIFQDSDRHLETTVSPSGPVCLQKKALLIGIQYYIFDTPASGQLKGPHVDVQNMRQLLIGKVFRCYHSHSFLISGLLFFTDCYGYNPDDITVLIDDGNPKHVQPTKENLVGVCTVFLCLNNHIFVKDTKHGRSRS